jgi:hypothetical protein
MAFTNFIDVDHFGCRKHAGQICRDLRSGTRNHEYASGGSLQATSLS